MFMAVATSLKINGSWAAFYDVFRDVYLVVTVSKLGSEIESS